MIFDLAELSEGTIDDVITELEKREPDIVNERNRAFLNTTVASFFDHGHLTGSEKNGEMHYNLSKITPPNSGVTNPDNLSPGLD